jgi:hypothetical protein
MLIAGLLVAVMMMSGQPEPPSVPRSATRVDSLSPQSDWRATYSITSVSKTLGFWIGQQSSLDRIATEFPAQARRATVLKLDAESKFGAGIAAINDYYSGRFPEWAQLNDKIKEQLAPMLSAPITEVEATAFLDDVEARLKGTIPAPIIETLLAFQPRFVSRPGEEFTEGFRTELVTTDNPRAKGVQFMMQHPMSWVTKEPRRPNITFLVRSQGGSGEAMAMLLVKDLSAEELAELKDVGAAAFADPAIVQEMGALFVAAGQMKLAGQEVPWTQYVMAQEVADAHVKLFVWSFHFVRGDKYINLQFQVSASASDSALLPADHVLEKRFDTYEPLFRHMLVSVDFQDRYR